MASVQDGIPDVAEVARALDQLGDDMTRLGDRLVQASDERGASCGAHWRADGAELARLAAELRGALTGQGAGPGRAWATEMTRLAARGAILAEHRRVMGEMVDRLAAQPGRFDDGAVAALRRHGTTMVVLGGQLETLAHRLRAAAANPVDRLADVTTAAAPRPATSPPTGGGRSPRSSAAGRHPTGPV